MIIEFPAPAPLLNLNGRMHWSKKAPIVAEWRKVAWVCGVNWLRGPWNERPGPSTVKVTLPVRSLKTWRDPHNFFATVKPIIDGLVDAKFWPDDTAAWVTTLEPEFWTGRNVLVEIYPREPKPCVPVDCPPVEEYRIEGIFMGHGSIEEFYAAHPEGVFGDPEGEQ